MTLRHLLGCCVALVGGSVFWSVHLEAQTECYAPPHTTSQWVGPVPPGKACPSPAMGRHGAACVTCPKGWRVVFRTHPVGKMTSYERTVDCYMQCRRSFQWKYARKECCPLPRASDRPKDMKAVPPKQTLPPPPKMEQPRAK